LSADGYAADRRYHLTAQALQVAEAFIDDWVRGTHPTWVAAHDGAIVGFMATKTAPAHQVLQLPATIVITDAYVVEDHRRRGIGQALFETVRDHARDHGFAAIEVGTLALDRRAITFWRSLGFGDWRVTLAQAIR
jgi:GNAT superfamily N-acetyltransferase